jgi:putative copper resistance protein D
MVGFLDVLLRGAILAAASVTLGGVVFAWTVLRGGPGVKPDRSLARSLRLTALGAGVAALAQLAAAALTLGTLVHSLGADAVTPYAATAYGAVTAARVALACVAAVLALGLARAPGGRGAWIGLASAATLLVASSAAISHAMARVDHRASLLALDAAHQVAAAVWIGGLLHLLLVLRGGRLGPADARDRVDVRTIGPRFSRIALAAVTVLVAAGGTLAVAYVGDPRALGETAYGVMVLTKVALLGVILAIAVANTRLVRRAAGASDPHARARDLTLARYVEVEAGLAVTVLFAAASLTSLPPAVDVRDDRATLSEVAARFTAWPPRFTSPDADELNRQTNPLAGTPQARLRIEREWSEFNHHWAGLFVLAIGLAAIAHRAGVAFARHWPLLLVALGLFLNFRSDPEVWPLGPVGFWVSHLQPEVLQHRLFMLLVVAFGLFEWAVRVGRLRERPWGYVFPALCAAGGGLLLTHSHAVFSMKEAFLMEVTHAPIGVLGAVAGWARWLELRLPDAGPWPARVWPLCLTAVGVLLIFYSEG